tara:strand:+ start:25431 stop:25604 length:174 start_codon:yes stop_codon:yes gene_type:complete
MNFSTINENPIMFLLWVTAFGMFVSLIEATLKIKYETYNNLRKREKLIRSLYPKKLA